jgi:hypothetical protein
MLPVWHLGKSPSNMIARRDPIACRADAPRRDSVAALSLSEIGFPSYFRAEGIIHSRNECPLMGTMNFQLARVPVTQAGILLSILVTAVEYASRHGLALCQPLAGCGGLSGDALWRGILRRA